MHPYSRLVEDRTLSVSKIANKRFTEGAFLAQCLMEWQINKNVDYFKSERNSEFRRLISFSQTTWAMCKKGK